MIVDHPADGLAAVEGRLGPRSTSMRADVAGEQVGEVVARAGIGRIVHLHPVDQHHRLRRWSAPRMVSEVVSPGPPLRVKHHAGRPGQDVGDVGLLVQPQICGAVSTVTDWPI